MASGNVFRSAAGREQGLQSDAATIGEQRNHKSNSEQNEKYFCDDGGTCGDTAES